MTMNLLGTDQISNEGLVKKIVKIEVNDLKKTLSLIKKSKIFMVKFNGLLQAMSFSRTTESGPGSLNLVGGWNIQNNGSILMTVRSSFNIMIRKRNKLRAIDIDNICNIIYEILRDYPHQTELHTTIYTYASRIFKLEYLQNRQIEYKRISHLNHRQESKNLRKLISVRTSTTALLLKIYEVNFKEVGSFFDIQNTKIYPLIVNILEELTHEENLARSFKELSQTEIDLALKDDHRTLNDTLILVPAFKRLLDLLYKITLLAKSDACSDMILKLMSQKYQILALIGGYSSTDNKHLQNFYLVVLTTMLKITFTREQLDYKTDYINQILLKLMRENSSKTENMKVMKAVRDIVKVALHDSKKENIPKLISFSANQMLNLRFKRNDPLETNSFLAQRTLLYLSWVNKLLRRVDNSPNLKDENETVGEDSVSYMKIWFLIMLDYKEIESIDTSNEVEQFAILSPSLTERCERAYSNLILRSTIFYEQRKSVVSRFKASTLKTMENINSKFPG